MWERKDSLERWYGLKTESTASRKNEGKRKITKINKQWGTCNGNWNLNLPFSRSSFFIARQQERKNYREWRDMKVLWERMCVCEGKNFKTIKLRRDVTSSVVAACIISGRLCVPRKYKSFSTENWMTNL